MSGPFDSLGISASGMGVYKTWLDATSDNLANINNAAPTSEAAFQERYVIARSNAPADGGRGGGARVVGLDFGDPNGKLVYSPEHPLADADGMIRLPDINMSDQMVNLIMAQRAYQANVTSFERARDAYLRALEIGR